MLLWKSIILVIVIFFNASHSSILNPEDFDTSILKAIDTVNKWFGLTANYVFNGDKNYPPIEEDVTFWIYSPGAPEFSQLRITDDADYILSKMVKERPLGFLIHGWIDSFDTIVARPQFKGWMKSTAKAWAINNNMSVISVDWNRLANYEYGIAAIKHTHMVGIYVGKYIEYLQDTIGISYDDIILTGHSLGGQITGFIGQYLNSSIGNIIALDPAGPLYTIPIDMGIKNRLDPTDAKFVQVLYTSCGTLGTQITSGHGNFWANGGVLQPGCIVPDLLGVQSDSPEAFSCSHFRAVVIFRSSCDPLNIYEGYECAIPGFCNMIESELKQNNVLPGSGWLESILIPLRCSNPTIDRFGIFSKRVKADFHLVTSARIA